MIPGPIQVEDQVLDAMGSPIRVHYGDEWVITHNETITMLQQVLQTDGKVFIMPGSGSLGVDAAVQSVFEPGKRVAVGTNGFFGQRLAEILSANGIDAVPVEEEPGTPLTPASFERILADDPSITGVAVVHLETSTAVLNPVKAIADVAGKHDCLCLVDAVSSLGGTELQMDAWGIDVCVSASQKCLGGPPGLAIVAVGQQAWERVVNSAERPRSWYLDLRRWQWHVENWGDWHPFPVTMPTSIVVGLHVALQSLLSDGLDKRIEHYQALAKRLRTGLIEIGISPSAPDTLLAPVLTAANCPVGSTSSQIVQYLADKHNIKITTGFGALKEHVIRIGHMGGAITEADIDALLDALRQFMHQLGTPGD
jgi:alanine-glyoxylate transaminase/serine-glyoxylate transaminase/serine-pyruvate transaminase